MILFIGDVDRSMRDREGFQEVDFSAMFGPLCKWAARIDSAERIPEYVARAYATAMAGRPGPVVLALPEDMLLDEVTARDRPYVTPPEQDPDGEAMQVFMDLLKDATDPIAIVGGAGWNLGASHYWAQFATRVGLPTAAAFRRQDALDNDCPVYAGNLGYGPNPKLLERIRSADLIIAVGARLGEATTDGYSLITPDHPGQTLIHVHPDPVELNSVYRTDLPICAYPYEFAEMAALWLDDIIPFDAGRQAHEEWRAWNAVTPFADTPLDLGPCVTAMQAALPADTIICNGAGNYSGWWHRHWRYAGPVCQLAPTAGAMGYGVPAAIAAARRWPDRTVVALAGDGDFLMNGQELATAVQYGVNLLVIVVDNAAYGTIRMHQEREYPDRLSATALVNPDFAALARAYGGWAATVESTEQFAPALAEAMGQKGLKLLHLKTDIERISNSTTISAMHARKKS